MTFFEGAERLKCQNKTREPETSSAQDYMNQQKQPVMLGSSSQSGVGRTLGDYKPWVFEPVSEQVYFQHSITHVSCAKAEPISKRHPGGALQYCLVT